MSTASCSISDCASQADVRLSLTEALALFDREAIQGTCDTGRYRCRYAVWGAGPPLLFVCGLSGDARSFVPLMARLRRNFRCISYDLPAGRGDGARLARIGHADLVADVFALLDELGQRQCAIMGFSFGSTVALAALAARPERFSRGVLESGFAYRRLAPAEVLLARLCRHWQAPIRQAPFRDAVIRRAHHGPFAELPPEVWRFFVERSGTAPIAAVTHRALLIHQLDLRSQLAGIRHPVLLVSGDADPLVNRLCTQTLAEGLPNAMHIELQSCGHYARYTHPGELAEAVRQFLTPPPCATGH